MSKMAELRAYYYNGGDMLELVRYQKEILPVAAGWEDVVLSCKTMLREEGKRRRILGNMANMPIYSIPYPQIKKIANFKDHIYGLLKHLRQERQMDIMKVEEGIYYIQGAYFPIQLLLTSELSKESNFWLRNLTNRLKERKEVNEIVTEYEKNRKNELHRAMMNIIIRANEAMFEEVKGEDMCEALRELFKDEIEEAKRVAMFEGESKAFMQLLREGILTVADVASRLNISEAEVQKRLAN